MASNDDPLSAELQMMLMFSTIESRQLRLAVGGALVDMDGTPTSKTALALVRVLMDEHTPVEAYFDAIDGIDADFPPSEQRTVMLGMISTIGYRVHPDAFQERADNTLREITDDALGDLEAMLKANVPSGPDSV